jgi:uncharacterized protein
LRRRRRKMEMLHRRSWSPYSVGAAIGALEVFSMLTAKRPLGITTAFENSAAIAAEKIAPDAMNIADYKDAREEEPSVDWEWALVAGVVAGSMLSTRLSGDPKPPVVPERWRREIGPSRSLRYASALAGGALMMFGARMAKGCTSGHGISGTMQFAASSWLFSPIIFAAGAAVARALVRRGR